MNFMPAYNLNIPETEQVFNVILKAITSKEAWPRKTEYSMVFIATDFAIVQCIRNAPFDGKYPFSFALSQNDGTWRMDGACFSTVDGAILGALGRKHLGYNDQFAIFSQRMLKINREE